MEATPQEVQTVDEDQADHRSERAANGHRLPLLVLQTNASESGRDDGFSQNTKQFSR